MREAWRQGKDVDLKTRRDDSVNKQADKPTDKTEGKQRERQGGVRCLTLMLREDERQQPKEPVPKQEVPQKQ